MYSVSESAIIFDLEAVGSDSKIFSRASTTSSGRLIENLFIFSPIVIKFTFLLTFLTISAFGNKVCV